MINCDAHVKKVLRDVPEYEARDEILVREHWFYDKSALYMHLGQEFFPLTDRWIVKPNISREGLGVGAEEVYDKVAQPKIDGVYTNVDRVGEHIWVYKAIRSGVFFDYFWYAGYGKGELTPTQCCKLSQLPSEVQNVEFLGDEVIEAHARISLELADLPPKRGDVDPIEALGAKKKAVKQVEEAVFCIPIWGEEGCQRPKEWIDTLLAVDEIFDVKWCLDSDEQAVQGKQRVCLVSAATYCPSDVKRYAEGVLGV